MSWNATASECEPLLSVAGGTPLVRRAYISHGWGKIIREKYWSDVWVGYLNEFENSALAEVEKIDL